MQTVPADLIERPPVWDDAQQVLDLQIRRDASEFGEPDSDLEDLQHDWRQMDLARDAWLLFTPDGELVGYGAVMEWVSGLRYELVGDPTWEGEGITCALLARCEERGLALAHGRGDTTGTVVTVYTGDGNARDRGILEQAVFGVALYHVQMQIEIGAMLPDPPWPEGVSCRTTLPGQDDRALHRLIQAAFERPGRTGQNFEDWKQFMMRPEIFQPGLWFLVFAGSELVGACLCFEYPELGWVRQLAVAETWRRKGLGSALLLHAFGEFKRGGFHKVGLTVASTNRDAYSFYQAVGMQPLRQYVEYRKVIGGEGAPID